MSHKQINRRYITGITLDPSVHAYLDDLAKRSRTSRSWMLNSIVYEYARMVENKELEPLRVNLKAPPSPEPVINL